MYLMGSPAAHYLSLNPLHMDLPLYPLHVGLPLDLPLSLYPLHMGLPLYLPLSRYMLIMYLLKLTLYLPAIMLLSHRHPLRERGGRAMRLQGRSVWACGRILGKCAGRRGSIPGCSFPL